jgi:hypothetical protein
LPFPSYPVAGAVIPDFSGNILQGPAIKKGRPENFFRLFHPAPFLPVPQLIPPMERMDDALLAPILEKLAIPVIPKGFPDLFAIHNCHLPAHCNSLTVFIIGTAMTEHDIGKKKK